MGAKRFFKKIGRSAKRTFGKRGKILSATRKGIKYAGKIRRKVLHGVDKVNKYNKWLGKYGGMIPGIGGEIRQLSGYVDKGVQGLHKLDRAGHRAYDKGKRTIKKYEGKGKQALAYAKKHGVDPEKMVQQGHMTGGFQVGDSVVGQAAARGAQTHGLTPAMVAKLASGVKKVSSSGQKPGGQKRARHGSAVGRETTAERYKRLKSQSA